MADLGNAGKQRLADVYRGENIRIPSKTSVGFGKEDLVSLLLSVTTNAVFLLQLEIALKASQRLFLSSLISH
jgi:hypothetical protein